MPDIDNALGYELGSRVVSTIESDARREPVTFRLLDREWELLPEVFPPFTDPGPGLFASWVPYEKGTRFLEMGCGAGLAAVLAALEGCERVWALDVNPAAAENARRNAERHGVADRVTALTGDLFAPLAPGETVDTIFWNTPFIEAPEGRPYRGHIERAVFDPGYGLVARFFREAATHLAPGGRVLIGTSEVMGNAPKMLRAAADAGFEGTRLRGESVELPPEALGDSETVRAHVDERGVLAMDFTLYGFTRP
ncbi:methyltransferase (plasmid) [Streptomyces sp. BI20]|uniref:methyltransferase n=1 Tax=Streptomyces sp. BI20 TaxID=3403460 RepID=UPI003C70CA94